MNRCRFLHALFCAGAAAVAGAAPLPVDVKNPSFEENAATLVPTAGSFTTNNVPQWTASGSGLFRPDTPEEYKPRLRESIGGRLAYVADCLSSSHYLLGDRFTVADAYLFTVLDWGRAVGIDIAQWPALPAFQERVRQRQSVLDALEAES